MANLLTGPVIIDAQAIADTSTTALHPLLTKAVDTAGNEYRYVKGVADGIVGAVVGIDETGQVALMVSGVIGEVGVLMAVLTASLYGWAMVKGSCSVKTAGDVADNAVVQITSTPGAVDDASTTAIGRFVFRAARTGAGLVLAQLCNPTFGM